MQRTKYHIGIVAVILMVGCGKSGTGPETAAVSGTVYLDGVPAADVEVNFMNGGYSIFGRTDAQGKYTLVPGAAVGDNKVYFSKVAGAKVELDPTQGMDEGQLMAMQDPGVHPALRPKQLIADEYSDPVNTKVSYVVPSSGATEADFQLRSK